MMEERVSQQGNVTSLWHGTKLLALAVIAILVVVAVAAFKAGQSLPGYWRKDFTVKEKGNPVNNPYHGVENQMFMFYGDPLSECMYVILIFTFALVVLAQLRTFGYGWLPVKRMWWTCLQVVIMLIAISVQTGMYLLTLQGITR